MSKSRAEYKTVSDEHLMQEVARGNSRAFEEIYERYNKPLINYFCRMLWKDREKAKDFMQDLFTKIVTKPESFNPERSFKTWLYSVAHNMCKNEYRKQEVRSNTHLGINEGISRDPHSERDEKHDKEIFSVALYKELDELDEAQRSTFLLRFKMELSIAEIAEITQTNEGTVKSRLFYTVRKLADKLKSFDPKISSQGI